MVKGAGMIRPNMATMLSFLVTDANIKASLLQKMLTKAAEVSYNSITVDGDTSTNDTVLLFANGTSGHPQLTHMDRDGEAFQSMLSRVCQNLAKSVVKDGEGATKLVEILIMGAKNREDAKKAAYAIAHSPLVKTAFFGEDANWGRIIAAIGHSGAECDSRKVSIRFNGKKIVENGMVASFDEDDVLGILKGEEIEVLIELGVGRERATVWTCDLSYDYVRINAAYRT
jgi:glutamate N-acetyltransferase/amino-acid N-acetyltransferase